METVREQRPTVGVAETEVENLSAVSENKRATPMPPSLPLASGRLTTYLPSWLKLQLIPRPTYITPGAQLALKV